MTLREIAELPCPPGVPVLGNARQIQPTRLHALLEGWAREYGRLYRFRLMRENVLVVNDHQLLSELLRDRPEALGRSKALRLTADELGANGVFSAEGDRWRTHRKLVMRALAPEIVKHFYPTMQRMTQRLLDRWNRALPKADPWMWPAISRPGRWTSRSRFRLVKTSMRSSTTTIRCKRMSSSCSRWSGGA